MSEDKIYRYRQFKLINSVGAEYDLCHFDHAFYAPDGLGFQKNISSVQVGNAFALVENKLSQQVIKGEMRFRNYELYSEFKEFISSGNLTLSYQPKGFTTWYYRNVEVQRLDKTEISKEARRLICAIDFLCFSQWYEKANAKRTVDLTGENTAFPLVFPFVFCDADKNELILHNERVSPAPCKIILSGPCINPAWVLRQNGRQIARGAMTISIADGEALIIDANIENMRIVKATADGEVNVYQHSDFTTERFLYAPMGESKLKFTDASGDAIDAAVEVRQVSDTV